MMCLVIAWAIVYGILVSQTIHITYPDIVPANRCPSEAKNRNGDLYDVFVVVDWW